MKLLVRENVVTLCNLALKAEELLLSEPFLVKEFLPLSEHLLTLLLDELLLLLEEVDIGFEEVCFPSAALFLRYLLEWRHVLPSMLFLSAPLRRR